MKIDAVLILNVSYLYAGDYTKEECRNIRANLHNIVSNAVSNGLLTCSSENLEVETWADQSFIEVSDENK